MVTCTACPCGYLLTNDFAYFISFSLYTRDLRKMLDVITKEEYSYVLYFSSFGITISVSGPTFYSCPIQFFENVLI